MDFQLQHCFLPIHDHEAALGFYRDVLGLKVVNDVEYEGMRWVSVSPPAQPELQIVLESIGGTPNASPQDRETIADLMAKGLLGRAVFSTTDCDAAFEQIASSGAEVVQEPMDQPYGIRDCAFRDPSGNLLRFTQTSGA
ncbi:MAG TPA: VOC family protein [Actinocrinis sp.]|jgi:predicted enzyme related to lactoylglutathione lyase